MRAIVRLGDADSVYATIAGCIPHRVTEEWLRQTPYRLRGSAGAWQPDGAEPPIETQLCFPGVERLLEQVVKCQPVRAGEATEAFTSFVGDRDSDLAGFGGGAHKTVVSLETTEGQLEARRVLSNEGKVALLEKDLDELESGHAREGLNKSTDHAANSLR